jgi:hypothetical protein
MAPRQPREGNSDANNSADTAVEDILNAGASGSGSYIPPVRYIVENGEFVPYDGPGLVGSNGKVVQDGPYDVETQPGFIYSSLSPRNQQALMQQLAAAGFISKGSIGDFSSEIYAVRQWLIASNMAGLEKQNYLNQRLTGRPPVSGGSGRRYQVSNPEDLKVVAKQVAQQTLGRGFTDEEADRFVQAFQAQQVGEQRRASGGGTMVQAPDADVAAQKFAQEQAPTEASAYKTLGYINKFFNAIGGV